MNYFFKVFLALSLLMASPASHAGIKPGPIPLSKLLSEYSEQFDFQFDASRLDNTQIVVSIPAEINSLSPDRALTLLSTLLNLEGLTFVRDTALDLYRIVKQRDARDLELKLIKDEKDIPASDEIITFYTQLKHVDGEFVARNMRSFMPAQARIIPVENAVLVTDSAHNIAVHLKLMRVFDTPENGKENRDALELSRKQGNEECS